MNATTNKLTEQATQDETLIQQMDNQKNAELKFKEYMLQRVFSYLPTNIVARIECFYNDQRNSFEGNIEFKKLVGLNSIEFFKEIIFDTSDSTVYEVVENQAGLKGNEQHIFCKTNQLKTAINNVLRNNLTPIEVWS